jgi:putative sterol carrier protein
MSNVEELKSMAEEMLEMSDDELMKNLPILIPKLKGHVAEIMKDMPDITTKIVQRMDKADVKRMASQAPEAIDAFTEILWEGVGLVAEKNAEFKNALKMAGSVKLNYEADDSSVAGHYEIKNAKLAGGPGKLNSADITVQGHTEVLIKLVTGGLDPMKGLVMRKYKLEGPLVLGMKLTGAFKAMADALKNP